MLSMMQPGLVLLLAAFAVRGFAQGSPAAPNPGWKQDGSLLSNVAWTYAQVLHYRVEVETKNWEPGSGEPAIKRRFVLAASKPAMWYVHELVLSPARDEVLLGSDGETVWGFAPRSKKYVRHERWFERTEEWVSGREMHSRYFRRFEMIDRVAARTQFLGYKTRSDGRKKVRCVLLRLLPERDDWTEDIWVDPQRNVVLRSVFKRKTALGLVSTETEWRNQQINGAVDPSLFSFTPPAGAKPTSAIAIP